LKFSVVGHETLSIPEAYKNLRDRGFTVKLLSSISQILLDCSKAEAELLKAEGFKILSAEEKVISAPAELEPGVETPSLEISRLTYANYFHNLGIDGSGVRVAILDSGIYPHPCFGGRIVVNEHTIGESPLDEVGHGTLIASICSGYAPNLGIVGIAPNSLILNIKVLEREGESSLSGTIASILEGIDIAIGKAAQVLNCSWGAMGGSEAVILALMEAIKRGILVIASAGNMGPFMNTVTSPAVEDGICSVGAVRRDGTIPMFTSVGKVDIVSYGVLVSGAGVGSPIARALASGSSFTSPQVAGFGLLMKQIDPAISQDYFLRLIPLIARKPWWNPTTGRDSKYGWGILFGKTLYDMFNVRRIYEIAEIEILEFLLRFLPVEIS